jgi:ATP-dependent DNA helicase RecG
MFAHLKLAVIDEQHKFGVKQRGFFQQFGSPHILQMTATPIPRSLALAFFGEFTVSAIDEMPAGRKPIITKIISESERHKLKPWILTKISQGQRVFVITPLIEESEFLDEVKSAFQQFDVMQQVFAPELSGRIGLLHGKLKADDKDDVMRAFKEGKLDMLVSTTVIEVGIDIPEATVMIIMNAERTSVAWTCGT